MRSDKGMFQLVYALGIFLLLLMTSGFGLNSSIAGASNEASRCIERERQALLAFKQGVVDYSGMLSGWGSEDNKKDCCKWRGVHCSNTTGHVIILDLHDMLLRGNLSSSLFELQHLIYLDLSRNSISGPIPSQLGNLRSLEFLDLSFGYNFDSVKNLEWLSHLSSLKYLNLSTVDLSKAVDWLQVVSKLPYLTDLKLSGCSLQDAIVHSVPMSNTSSLVVLDLGENNLTASTFKWLFRFSPSLVQLDLSENHLQGLIPEALSNMTSLENLDLGLNELEGGIPMSFGNLCRLRELHLSENHLQGLIPEAIGNMAFLEKLDLAFNVLEGGIPKSFGNLCRLRELHLYVNQLNGMLPQIISNLSTGCLHSSLERLWLSENQITGWLPNMIANFSSLKVLYLSDNNLSGTLPKSIGVLSNLVVLYMDSNNFSGVITETHFLNLSKLEQLGLSSNHFSINFSRDWKPPFQLYWMNLGSCMLGPEFPKWIKTQRNLFFLNISHSGISDSIPKWLWNPSSSVRQIDLSFNNFSTTLSADLSIHLRGFPGIEMNSGSLKGPLPLFPANVSSINLSNNSFSGSIFSLCSITGGALEFLDLSNNQLSGKLPNCLNHWPNLKILNLVHNRFSGQIPHSVGKLSRLESVSLRSNSLVGEVPWSLGNCSRLQFVDLSYNRLSGRIPYWIGERLPILTFLLIKSNNFNGGIPLQLCQLTNVLLLDLSNNSFTGSIPWCIHHMTALTRTETSIEDHYFTSFGDEDSSYEGDYADRTFLVWKGTEYEFKDIKNRKVLDFSNNKLTGTVPAQIWNLIGLVQLNLSRNQLTGLIPPDMEQMQQLNSLDLSRNQFSGHLPQSMFQLTSLGVLNVSNNNFSGRVPSGPQSYEATSFVGNSGLCGLALNLTCPGDEEPNNNSAGNGGKGHQRDKNGSFWAGFKPGLEIGAAIGFVGVLALRLGQPWKQMVSLMFKKMVFWFKNLKDLLYLIIATLAFLVKEIAAKLGRKLL